MAEHKLESVLEFLRKNGFSQSESALLEDVMEKSQLASSELERFFFPMPPPPPPLRIPSSHRLLPPPPRGELSDATADTSKSSSDDEFEKDEDYAMPPLFGGRDFDGDPSEDKYVMTVQTEGCIDDQVAYNFIPDGSTNLEKVVKSMADIAPIIVVRPLTVLVAMVLELFTHMIQRTQTGKSKSFGNNRDVGMVKKDSQLKENDDYDFIYDEVIASKKREPKVAVNEENGATSDELLLYEAKEDDYEIFNLRIIHRKKDHIRHRARLTGFEENREFPVVMNSIIAGRYYVTEFLGSAAFSKVVQAHDLYSGMDHDPADEQHILRLYDYFYYQEHLFIVTELLRANLYEFQKFNRESGGEPYFTMHRLQVITRQCLEAVLYLHDLGIIHCDLKPENILIKRYRTCEIKVIDLGSSCFQNDNLSLYVQSRSYRAPEVMLGLPYDEKIDLWSVGCILAELCSGSISHYTTFLNLAIVIKYHVITCNCNIGMLGPIDMNMLKKGQETHKYFTKEYDLYYVDEDTSKIEYIVPKETSLEHHLQISDSCFIDFLKHLLEINPKRRPTAREALQHPWLLHSYEVNSF
ncbi:UNVERIFIED_CONTAM: DYRK-family kinase pom1 [Sesamum calycinum]|uniref:DYRK-family kinase pom1 n=1 Tax=Sesamum calycinum TaxID=2727403 RepID=A0AAW2RRQ0_9LAMI